MPEFSVSGDGRFEASFSSGNLQLAGRLAGGAGRLEVVDPRLRELDGLGATAAFDLRYERGRLRVADLAATVTAGRPVLSVQAAQAFTVDLGTGAVTPSGGQRELVRIGLEGVPMSWIRPFLPALGLSGDAITGEVVAAVHGADRVWLRTVLPLAVHGLAVRRGAAIILPTSDVSLDAEVEHSPEGTRVRLAGLTAVAATGDRLEGRGELSVAPDGAVSAQASFDASLPTLLQEHVPAGPLAARGSMALARSGDVVEVERMEAHLATADGRPLLDLVAPDGFRVGPRRGEIATRGGAAGEVLRVSYGPMPLDQLGPWDGLLVFKGELAGGGFALRAEDGRLWIDGAAPLRLEKISAAGGETALAKDLAVEAEPSFDWSPQGGKAGLARVRVKNPNGDVLLSGGAVVAFETDSADVRLQGSASFDLAVPALAGQPFMAGVEPPRQGRLTGEVKFSFDHNLLGEGRLTLNGLVSPATGESLPVANLSFRAGLDEKGNVAVQVPVLVDCAGERSDLTLAATLRPAADGGRTVDGRITGGHFAVDDVLLLLRAFPDADKGRPGAQAAPPAPPQSTDAPGPAEGEGPAAPVAPGWAGLAGQVRFDVKSVGYGRLPEVRGLTGRLVIEPGRLALEDVTAGVGAEDGRLKLAGEVLCGAAGSQPCHSTFDLEVKTLDLGAVFKAVDPGKPPTFEGLFDVHGRAEGVGRTLGGLLRQMQLDLDFQSRKGICRLLARPAPPRPAGASSGVAGTAARLIDNIGEKVGKIVSSTDSTDEIAGMLGEVPFDQLSVRLSRDRSADVRLSGFSLVSPVLRLQGGGVIAFDAEKPLFNRPLKLTLNLGVMGAVEKAMTQAKAPMLSANRDDLGYLKSTEAFDVVGTLDEPEPGQLYTMVARSMIGKLLH